MHPLDVQVQNNVRKFKACTSIPCSSMSLTAKMLSNPPENNATAFLFMRGTLFQLLQIFFYLFLVSGIRGFVILFLFRNIFLFDIMVFILMAVFISFAM